MAQLGRSRDLTDILARISKSTPLVAACITYVLAGCALLPYNGIEDDESLFANPIYRVVSRECRIRVFHRNIPLMVMDYVGAFKSWIYSFIFAVFEPSKVSLRLPVLLIGAITIALFYELLLQVVGKQAAIVGCFLLATDTIFLMTTLFDWGPVAIQHLVLVAGCVQVAAFHRTGSKTSLAGGFLALGLGLWDKAIFVWLLGGLAIAGLALFPRWVIKRLCVRNVACASIAFLLGAWPLLVYNARHHWTTFRNNATISSAEAKGKLIMLKDTINGSGLFGYMVNDADAGMRGRPETTLERVSITIAKRFGEPKENYLLGAFCLTVAILPLWLRRWREILFGLVFMAVAWIQMALTRNAGGGVHHTVLLWPFPHYVLAIAFSEASQRYRRIGRPALIAVATFLCATNLLVTNQYLSQLIRYGQSVTWTDAIFNLSDLLRAYDSEVYIADWGLFDQLIMLNKGRLAAHMIARADGEFEDGQVDVILADRRAVFVTHVRDKRFFPKTDEHLESAAATRGYERLVLATVADSKGRPVFEVYRFGAAGGQRLGLVRQDPAGPPRGRASFDRAAAR